MSYKRTLRIVLICLAVLGAGCAGWGTDGPAEDDDPDPNEADELEDAQDDAANGQTDRSNGTEDVSDESSSAPGTDADESTSEENTSADDPDTDDSVGATGDEPGESADSDDEGPEDNDHGVEEDTDQRADDSNDDEDGDRDSETDEEETHTLTVTTGEEPAPNVLIWVTSDWDDTDIEQTTNEDGVATFELPDGEYIVDWQDKNNHTATVSVTIDGNDEEVTLPLESEYPETGSVTITASDAQLGGPIEDASITGNGDPVNGETPTFSLTTDEEGVAQTETEESDYQITIEADGYETKQTSAFVGENEDVSVDVELEPETTNGFYEQTLTVIVLDQDGEPVEGETVEYGPPDDEPNEQETTNEDGEAVLTGVTSVPSDATMVQVYVADQEQGGSLHMEGGEMIFEIDTTDDNEERALSS